jgi:hypothetical protein
LKAYQALAAFGAPLSSFQVTEAVVYPTLYAQSLLVANSGRTYLPRAQKEETGRVSSLSPSDSLAKLTAWSDSQNRNTPANRRRTASYLAGEVIELPEDFEIGSLLGVVEL